MATDGNGTVYTCALESFTKKGLTGFITGRTVQPRLPFDLRLLVGLPERAAFESLLVDLTALGVRRITPAVCKHCQQPWWVRDWEKFSERHLSKMSAGMKQSLYPYLPLLDPPTALDLAWSTISGQGIVADADGIPFSEALTLLPRTSASFSALIGPPGGLSPEELLALEKQGALAVKISETRLTTELASVVVSGLLIGTYQE